MAARHLSLLISVLLVLATVPVHARGAAEGAKPPDAGGKEAGRAGPPAVYREAPLLAGRVADGTLPSLDKRLPAAPLVLASSGDGARYGGTWRLVVTRPQVASLWTSGIRARVVGLSSDFGTVEPEILSGFAASPDNRVFTLSLREGLKWSDGDPCDADDFVFAFQDVLLDPDLWPAKPAELVAGDRLPRLDKVDRYTVKLTFTSPNVLFLRRLAQPRVDLPLLLPQHYLKQFHPKHAQKEKLEALVSGGPYASWVDLFAAKSRPWQNPELPVLDAWVVVDDGSDGAGGALHLERNPYFWQTDAAGNQLPYIDRVEVTLVDGEGERLRLVASGAVDMPVSGFTGASARAELEAGGAGAGYRLVDLDPMNANIHTVFLNRATADAGKARLFGDIRFREALSVSVDREAINQEVHGGRARPSQVSLPVDAPSYDGEAALAYTTVDAALASGLLDDLGLDWDEQGKHRLGQDRKPLVLTVSYSTAWPPGQVLAVAHVIGAWRAIGLNVRGEALGRDEWLARVRGDGWDLAVYAVNAGGGAYLPLSSDGVFPIDGYWFPGPSWGSWLATGGARGSEPPADVKKLFSIYREYTGTAAGERVVELERQAFGLYARELFAIGVLSRPRGELFTVVAVRIQGLPERQMLDDLRHYRPAAFFITD